MQISEENGTVVRPVGADLWGELQQYSRSHIFTVLLVLLNITLDWKLFHLPLGPKLLHYITLLFRIEFPDYVITLYITDLVSNFSSAM